MVYEKIDYLDNLSIIFTTVVSLNTVQFTVVKNTVLEIFSFSVNREKGGFRQRRKKIFNKFSRSGNFSGLRRFVRFGFAEKISASQLRNGPVWPHFGKLSEESLAKKCPTWAPIVLPELIESQLSWIAAVVSTSVLYNSRFETRLHIFIVESIVITLLPSTELCFKSL